MGYNNLRLQIIVRVTAIALSLFLLFQLVNSDAFSLTILLVLTLVVVQVIALIKFLDKTNQEIIDFFNALKRNDFSISNPKLKFGDHNNFLHEQFQIVANKIKKIKLAKDVQQQYLTTIVQHVGIGLITFNEKGDIQIINIAAKRLLKTEGIKNINELSPISKKLVHCIWDLKTGGRSLINVTIGGDEGQISVYAIELTQGNEKFKLISLQNIRSELEEKEMEAWQKIVRVLTHEIMNSVTPISSLAHTVEGEINGFINSGKSDVLNINREELEDIYLAVQTVQRRSDGLIRFVNDFRSLTQTPEPKLQSVVVRELFDQITVLLKHEISSCEIKFIVNIIPENLKLIIDPELIQQVLINLIKNAVQALEDRENKIIELIARRDNNKTFFIIKDNGPGIEEEAQTKIFIPFFTTKKSGSGIGLSLSRQIMRQHNASISVKSKVDEGTEFILRF